MEDTCKNAAAGIDNHFYRRTKLDLILGRLRKDRWLYIMVVPGVIYYIIFKYGPMFGLVMSFEDYQPFLGFFKSRWTGMANFARLFSDPYFPMLLRNTIILGLYNIIFFFPLPIIVSLLLNEVRKVFFKSFVQTMIYIPHFLSWVVVASLTFSFFTVDGGIVNNILTNMGMAKIDPLLSVPWFRPMIMLQLIWKETGWGTIIILAALAGVNPELYSAAEIDGAGRWGKLWHITLPGIRSTIFILFILRLSGFMELGFEQIFLMINAMNRNVGEIFDTYIYRIGIVGGQFSYTAAVGMFKSVVSLVLVFMANYTGKKIGEEGIF